MRENKTSVCFFLTQGQQIEIHFVRQGGHVNAIGAFVEGVKQKTDKSRLISDSNKFKIKLGGYN